MKLGLKKLMILLGLLTIVLPSISQIKYIINSDSIKTEYACYTNDENREIAITFLEGERDKALLDNCDSIVESLTTINSLLTDKIKVQDNSITELKTSYTQVQVLARESDKANKKVKFQLVVSKVLVGVLSVLLLIKIL